MATKRIDSYTHLSRADDVLILQLHEQGLTQTEIAQRIGCHQSSVSVALAEFADTRHIAKAMLHNGAQKLARRVIEKADVEESLEVLDRIGVAEKRDTGKSGVQVNVLVGECPPGLPARPVNIISGAACAVGDARENP